VEWIVRELAELWGKDARWERGETIQPHEAQTLKLDWSKAESRLGWRPALRLKEALAMTTAWYKARLQNQNMRAFTLAQIDAYERLADQAKSETSHPKSSGVHA
jgi:CDP-glucose 4,6-dehydratase